jgi:hypothetical protein
MSKLSWIEGRRSPTTISSLRSGRPDCHPDRCQRRVKIGHFCRPKIGHSAQVVTSLKVSGLEYPRKMVLLKIFWTDAGHESGIILGRITNAPTFVLVPRVGGGYTAVERTAPWRTQEGFAFEGGCLVAGEMRACRD